MQQQTRIAVVTLSVSFAESEGVEPQIIVAREDRIGIHGYGHTREDAQAHLEKVLETLLSKLAIKGILEKKLDSVGMKWRWADTEEEPPQFIQTGIFIGSQGPIFGQIDTKHLNWGQITGEPLVTDSRVPIPA